MSDLLKQAEKEATTEIEAEVVNTETADGDEVSETDEVPEVEEAEEEITVSIDGDDEGSPASEDEKPENPWLLVREQAKENRELKRELKKHAKPAEAEEAKQPEKPTLESCDYDDEAYEQKMEAYFVERSKFDEQQAKAKKSEESQQQEWQGKLDTYTEQKKELRVSDDVEQVVLDELSEMQQGIIVTHAKNAGLVVLALGSNPDKAKELGAISNPIDFAFAVRELEGKAKVNKRTPPKPETKLGVASTGSATAKDKHLEKLRSAAEASGDYTAVSAYRRSLQAE